MKPLLLASLLKTYTKRKWNRKPYKKVIKRSSVLFNVICNLWLTLYARLSIYLYRETFLQMCLELKLFSLVYSQSTNLRLNWPSIRPSHSLVWHDFYWVSSFHKSKSHLGSAMKRVFMKLTFRPGIYIKLNLIQILKQLLVKQYWNVKSVNKVYTKVRFKSKYLLIEKNH